MKYIFLTCAAVLQVALPHFAEARPVSYPGGWTLMQMNDNSMHSLHAHYSPTAHYSIGYKAEYWTAGNNWQFHGAQLNYLVKRWNKPSSQANFYLKSGAGIAYSDDGAFNGKTQPAAFTGLAMDWENRRYFTSYSNRVSYAGDIDKFFMQKARIGIAPYVGDYGDVHTWLMLEVDHNPTRQDELQVSPVIRLFKGEYLTELGVSQKGDVLFNFVVRF